MVSMPPLAFRYRITILVTAQTAAIACAVILMRCNAVGRDCMTVLLVERAQHKRLRLDPMRVEKTLRQPPTPSILGGPRAEASASGLVDATSCLITLPCLRTGLHVSSRFKNWLGVEWGRRPRRSAVAQPHPAALLRQPPSAAANLQRPLGRRVWSGWSPASWPSRSVRPAYLRDVPAAVSSVRVSGDRRPRQPGVRVRPSPTRTRERRITALGYVYLCIWVAVVWAGIIRLYILQLRAGWRPFDLFVQPPNRVVHFLCEHWREARWALALILLGFVGGLIGLFARLY